MSFISKSSFFVLVGLVTLFACRSDNGSAVVAATNQFAQLKEAYTANPSSATGNSLIKEILETLKTDLTDSKKTELLEYGYKVATEQNNSSRAASFLFPLIKESPSSEATSGKIFELAGLMKKIQKLSAADVLYSSLVDNQSGFAKIEEAKAAISEPMESVDDYIFKLGEQLFVDVDNTGINRNAAMKYVDACEAYALGYPGKENTPEILFKSAEVAKSIRTFPKSLALYDWIIEKYPSYEKAPTALFLKGFIIENNLKDDVKAKEIYDQFLAKYPSHDLADDVQFLIENIGKTDEEILQMIEEKRKAKEQSK